MGLRMVPSNGVPVSAGTALRFPLMAAGLTDGTFEERIGEYTGMSRCFGTCSGRAGLVLALESLKRIRPDRPEVLIAAYTCQSVYYAVVRAGLRPVLYDVDPETLGTAADRLETLVSDRTLCVISSTMFGIAIDMPAIRECCHARGVFLVEDVAQSLGSRWCDRPLGSFGDISVFSFGKGKNITTITGGMACTDRPEIGDAMQSVLGGWQVPSPADTVRITCLFAANMFVIRPFYFKLLTMSGIAFAELEFDGDFPLKGMGGFQKRLGVRMLGRLDVLSRTRRDNARKILDGIAGESAAVVPLKKYEPEDGYSVYLRLPVYVRDPGTMEPLVEKLNRAGIWGRPARYAPLYGLTGEDGSRFPGAAATESRLLLLPTHPYMTGRDCDRMIRIIGEV